MSLKETRDEILGQEKGFPARIGKEGMEEGVFVLQQRKDGVPSNELGFQGRRPPGAVSGTGHQIVGRPGYVAAMACGWGQKWPCPRNGECDEMKYSEATCPHQEVNASHSLESFHCSLRPFQKYVFKVACN